MKNQRPLTLSRKDVIHLDALVRMTAGNYLAELCTQRGEFKEHCVEGAIARLDAVVSAQHDHGIGNRVEDRLSAFALVDDLIDARAERSHVGERQHGSGDLAIAFAERGYPYNKPPIPVAKLCPGFHSACDDLAALLFQTGHASENRDIARRPTNVGRREAKHVRRRLIEARDHEVASQGDDRNFNGVEDIDQICRGRVRGPVVTVDCRPEASPAAIERGRLSGHQAAPAAE